MKILIRAGYFPGCYCYSYRYSSIILFFQTNSLPVRDTLEEIVEDNIEENDAIVIASDDEGTDLAEDAKNVQELEPSVDPQPSSIDVDLGTYAYK